MAQTRRDFIKVSALATAGTVVGSPLASIAENKTVFTDDKPLHISVFSKPLQFLNYEDMANAVKEIGFDGIDLTVRPKGHVLPENVEHDLPKATEAMKRNGLSSLMFASGVDDATNPLHQKVLATAARLGYKFYRPAWFKYGNSTTIAEDAAKFTKQLIALAKLSKELGIACSYQNRSGLYFGAPVWDLNAALEQCDHEAMGNQYDIMHNVVEGGKSWEIDFKLIRNKINTLVLKDVIWRKKNGIWDKEYVPMGEGMVDFAHYFKLLKQFKINVPITIHQEYDMGGAEKGGKPSIPREDIFAMMKKDLDFVRNLWSKVIAG